ncbi:hypothetical protein [Lacticaseibacillus parakribbianus]|uniref:hypothetical protein n=1 Tax=Lacticaseibacillus parakribbianus TaxID=2970927 RepID=UPI0021CB6FAB|nr:hypothetical protein [Lacticaseibacillus parakribbianus]
MVGLDAGTKSDPNRNRELLRCQTETPYPLGHNGYSVKRFCFVATPRGWQAARLPGNILGNKKALNIANQAARAKQKGRFLDLLRDAVKRDVLRRRVQD